MYLKQNHVFSKLLNFLSFHKIIFTSVIERGKHDLILTCTSVLFYFNDLSYLIQLLEVNMVEICNILSKKNLILLMKNFISHKKIKYCIYNYNICCLSNSYSLLFFSALTISEWSKLAFASTSCASLPTELA